MKIGGSSSKKPSFGSSSGKPKAKSRPVEEHDDDLEVDFTPIVSKKAKKAISKLDVLTKRAKVIAKKVEKEKPAKDEDDFVDEEDDSGEVIPREKSLATIKALGIKSFEVGPEEILPEDGEDESLKPEQIYDNVRKNNQAIDRPAKLPGAPANRVRAVRTMFGQRADAILGLLEDDQSTDGALTLIQRTLLQTLVDVLPVIERSVRRSHGKRGVIPMNQTISQIRELTSDIQSLRDRGQLGASIVERVLRPAFLDIAVQLVKGFADIEGSAKNRMNEGDFGTFVETLNETKRNLANYIQAQYTEVKEGVASSLS